MLIIAHTHCHFLFFICHLSSVIVNGGGFVNALCFLTAMAYIILIFRWWLWKWVHDPWIDDRWQMTVHENGVIRRTATIRAELDVRNRERRIRSAGAQGVMPVAQGRSHESAHTCPPDTRDVYTFPAIKSCFRFWMWCLSWVAPAILFR